MANGTHGTVAWLALRLRTRWVPKWHEAFADPRGGFHERLGRGFRPLPVGYKRLLTQCRQLAMYSHAAARGDRRLASDLSRRFDWLVRVFHVSETGGWRFSVDDAEAPLDESYDFYGHGFVIFALSHYYRATRDPRARDLAASTLKFVEGAFRMEGGAPGFAEALGPDLRPVGKIRRHESHMHFLEGCLFAYETWGDPAYLAMARELTGLFFSYFMPKDRALAEYYADDLLSPHREQGHVTEPGHYYEWIWLLKKMAFLEGAPDRHDALCLRMLEWANRHGWDAVYGGIYDELNPDGSALTPTKRLWPFTEGLKANALMLDCAPDRQALKDHVARMVAVFRDSYMDERGFWVEWLNRDLSPATDYMPGTTPYHVYFGIMETLEGLDRRGRAISIAAGPRAGLYLARRILSAQAKKLRGVLPLLRSGRGS